MMHTEGQGKATPNIQPAATAQTLQPAAAGPTGVVSSVETLTQPRFHWYHAFLAVGLLAVSGAGTAVLIKVSTIFLCSTTTSN